MAARVDEDVRRRGYHLTTGNLMTKYLLEVLTAYGYLETAYRLVVQTTYPSWGYMLSKDATTIWERWEYETGYGMNSHNHPMYGSISAWFYKYLAGISAEAPGFAAVKIQPYLPEELPFVRCSLETCAGRIGSSWSRETDGVELLVEIPGDVTADLYLPIPARTPRASTGTACHSGGGIPARFRMTPFGLSAGSRAIFTLPAGAGITGSGSTDIPQPK